MSAGIAFPIQTPACLTLSRKDKKFWKKERNAAMNGLADVHYTNNDTFVKVICALGAGLLIGNKLLNSNKK